MLTKKKLIIEPGGGLCNRLIGVNNAIHLSNRISDLDVIIAWWNEPECGCDYKDILKPVTGIPVKNYYRPYKNRKELLREGKILRVIISSFQNAFFRYYFRVDNPNRIASFWEELPDCTEDKLIKIIELHNDRKKIYYRMGVKYNTGCFLREQDFSDSIQCRVGKIRGRLPSQQYIGLHIRRTDHEQAIKESPNSFFVDSIDRELELDKNKLFYLATDDQKTENYLRGLYGNAIVTNAGCIRGRDSAEAIQDAAVDLIMLSGAKKIYGSKGSTFSWLASELGKAELIL